MAASAEALLLVDGYNVIGAWTLLKQIRDHDGLESARRELVEALINYAAHQDYQTQVVFDSQYQKSPSSRENHSPHLSVYFTDWAQTADTYIEKFCASFSRQVSPSPSRLIVATSDRAQRLTVVGYGAEWLSAQRLATEIELSIRQVKRKQRPSKPTQGRFLFDSLDPKAQERLTQWRRGIY